MFALPFFVGWVALAAFAWGAERWGDGAGMARPLTFLLQLGLHQRDEIADGGHLV